MQHVKCIKCHTAISKTQRDSHHGQCGMCYASDNQIATVTGSFLIDIWKSLKDRLSRGGQKF